MKKFATQNYQNFFANHNPLNLKQQQQSLEGPTKKGETTATTKSERPFIHQPLSKHTFPTPKVPAKKRRILSSTHHKPFKKKETKKNKSKPLPLFCPRPSAHFTFSPIPYNNIMKISSLALASFLAVLSADSSRTTTTAFQPSIISNTRRHQSFVSSSSSSSIRHSITSLHVASTTDTFNATGAVNDGKSSSNNGFLNELGLENDPISLFGKGHATVSDDDSSSSSSTGDKKQLLGGKGANLAEMSRIGLSVPPGFTITTECCHQFCNTDDTSSGWNQQLPTKLWEQVKSSVKTIEDGMDGRTFGLSSNPLLLSVRSGAAISMPGMMDTVLNLGMNDDVVEGLAEQSSNPRFAWDSYRRFLEMFGNVVLDIPRHYFEDEIDDVKYDANVFEDSDLSTDDLKEVVKRFKGVYSKMDLSFPEDVYEQLELAVGAVFKGWMGDRAVKYREVENIRNLLGTAVNVQAMVFGNMGDTSGTGVCFTRDPNNGENKLFGEFLMNAQGEDVVAGIRTPKPISELEDIMPGTYLHCNISMNYILVFAAKA